MKINHKCSDRLPFYLPSHRGLTAHRAVTNYKPGTHYLCSWPVFTDREHGRLSTLPVFTKTRSVNMGSVYRCLCSRPVFMVYVLTPVNTDREHIMVRYKFID